MQAGWWAALTLSSPYPHPNHLRFASLWLPIASGDHCETPQGGRAYRDRPAGL